ncbi:MAG: carboxypeptidase regulatory-like domain-containing protein, partial [Desulfobacterales bacterium]
MIIDPYINFASRLGGEGDDWAHGIAVDAAGNAYITGKTGSSEFPVYSAYQGILKGEFDAFVAKISAVGNQLEYVTYLGGQGEDAGNDIVVTAGGEALLVGETTSDDFPFDAGYMPVRPTYGGNGDAFVAVLNNAGTSLQYTSYIGGSGADRGLAIARNAFEIAFIAGETTSSDFLPATTSGAGALQPSNNGNGDGFVVKFNPDATAGYSTFLGGSQADSIIDIAVDDEGNLYAAGQTASASDSFPATGIDFKNALSGQADAFVAKFNADGSAVTYFRYIGGSADDGAAGIGLDRRGNAYLTGFTLSDNFPTTPDVLQPTAASAPVTEDAFVSKISGDGSSLVYSTFLGGNAYDSGRTILVSPTGYAYVAGETLSASFPVTDGAFQEDIASDGFRDAFLAKINLNGTSLLFSTYLGGSDEDWAEAVSGGEAGSIFMTGSTASEDFPISNVDYVLGPNEPIDVFAVRVDGIDRSVISGTVRSAQEVPLANARVSADNDAAGFSTEVFTGSGGEYFLADLPAGCYRVQVLPPDGTTYVIGVQSGFYVEEGETVTGLDFYLPEGGLTLSGTIGRPDGSAAAGVQIIYENETLNIWRAVWTDGSGFYEFSNLPAGPAGIRVEPYDNLAATSRSINLFADTINFDFQLERGACLAGRVVNSSGDGVSGVWVDYDSDALDIGLGSSTDSNGYFSICNLPEGIAQLQVEVDPSDARSLCASAERTIYVQAGIDTAVKPFTLGSCALVEGRVITDTPADACGLEVYSDGVDYGAHAELEDGFYSLRLPPGTHKIYLDPNQEGPYSRAAYPVEVAIETTDIGSPTAVSVPDMLVTTAAGPDAGSVSGNIVKVNGDDPSGAFFVGLLPAGQLAAASPEALANTSGIQEKFMLPPPGFGEFTLTPVPPGQYDAFCAVVNSANGDIDSLTIIGSQPITVNSGQALNLSNFEYEYSGSSQITGTILDQYGQAVLGATVLVIDSTGALAAFAKTAQNGDYAIYNLPVGEYTVQASHPLYNGRPTTTITGGSNFTIPSEPLTLGYQAVSSPPGLDIVYNYYGAFTWTISTSSGPYTGLVFEAMVVDHDGVAGDGSSHVVEVTYPNGGPTKRLNFSRRINGNSA